MARTVTLSQLRTDARLYSDQRPGGSTAFISDTELTRLVNMKLAELYDMLVAARGHEHYITSSTISIVAGTSTYNLPAAFYELYSLTLEWASDEHELVEAIDSVSDRHKFTNEGNWERWTRKGYRIRSTTIEILPTPTSAVTGRLQYLPAFTDLSADGDTFDGVNGWEKLVTLGVAIEMRTIRKDKATDLLQLYDEQVRRIESMSADRAAEAPKRIRDVAPGMQGVWWPTARPRG